MPHALLKTRVGGTDTTPQPNQPHLPRAAHKNSNRYDHLASVPGFNGPLPWQRQNLELLLEEPGASGGAAGGPPRVAPRQVLLGLNFYG